MLTNLSLTSTLAPVIVSHEKVCGQRNRNYVDDEQVSFQIHRFSLRYGQVRLAAAALVEIVGEQHVKLRHHDESTKAVFVDLWKNKFLSWIPII